MNKKITSKFRIEEKDQIQLPHKRQHRYIANERDEESPEKGTNLDNSESKSGTPLFGGGND
jgi:hypothetical protein